MSDFVEPILPSGKRPTQSKPSVPIAVWIVGIFGGVLFLCCGGPVMLTIVDAPRQARLRQEREAEKQKLEAELPDSSTGHDWVKASDEAKDAIIDRIGPSWTSMNHDTVKEKVDQHYETAQSDSERLYDQEKKIGDTVKSVMDQLIKDREDRAEQEMREYWTKRAGETTDPDMRNEYLRRAIFDP